MKEAADRLKNHCQSQLDLTLGPCRAGVEFCEKITEVNTATVRKLPA